MDGAKRITIGIVAHVDAGKTTLSEALLFKSGVLRTAGRVDHGSSHLDDTAVEKNRGITVFSRQAVFDIRPEQDADRRECDGQLTHVTLIDTPGHIDFACEMERSLSVIDYAVLVISGSEGVQAHTRTLYRMLHERQIPVIIFVNKMDIAVRRSREIIADIAKELDAPAVDFSGAADRTEDFIDDITLYSPELAGIYLENGELTDEEIAGAVWQRDIIPCAAGSALKMTGVDGKDGLLEVLRRYTLEPAYGSGVSGRVYKVQNGSDGERLCFIKVTGGELRVRDRVEIHSASGDSEGRINQIRLYSGSRFRAADSAAAGTVCAVSGLPACAGDGIGNTPPLDEPSIRPFIASSVKGPEGMDPYILMKDLEKLAEEDPALSVRWRPDSGEPEIRLMGRVQTEVLASVMRDRFGYEVMFGENRIVYMETVSGTYEGVGHFEPLRHYAEVHLIIEPGERGSGIVTDSEVAGDELAWNWQRLILTHIEEKEHAGVLTGAPLTDVKITLAAGRAHEKHTNGGDFREATYRAVRNALMQARADGRAVLLEPWYEYDIELPSSLMGRAMTDIQQMGGIQKSLEQNGDRSRITGLVPASEINDYQQVFAGYTSGEGRLGLSQAGYDVCHDAASVIEERGYDPERDTDNTADSVFVNHGGSDIVRWDKVNEHMHLPSVLRRRSRISGQDGEHGHVWNDAEEAGRLPAVGAAGRDREREARESELRMIFERTYGSRSRKPGREARERHYREVRSVSGENDARNLEIRARHAKRTASSPDLPVLIIVDAYNLIYSDDYLKELAADDMGAARDQLLERLCNYAAYTGCEMTAVFDAYRVPYGAGSEEDYLGIKVIYTKEDEPADIRMGMITGETKDRRMYVVSSDSLVQQDAFTHGALRIPSGEFLRILEDTEAEIRSELK